MAWTSASGTCGRSWPSCIFRPCPAPERPSPPSPGPHLRARIRGPLRGAPAPAGRAARWRSPRVSLLAVTEQYLDFLRLLPGNAYRLDCLAEFLVVGAQLLVLKSRALLPRPEPAPGGGSAPRRGRALEARLAEYRRYRERRGALAGAPGAGRSGPSPARARPPSRPLAPPPRLEHGRPGAARGGAATPPGRASRPRRGAPGAPAGHPGRSASSRCAGRWRTTAPSPSAGWPGAASRAPS